MGADMGRDMTFQRALLEAVTGATDVMLVYLDPEFNFVWVNDPYARTCQMRPEEMIGRNHFELYPDAENEAIFRGVRDTGAAVFYKDKPFEFPDQPERGLTYWDWSLAPVKDAADRVEGLVLSLRETTEYKRAELRLAQRQQQLYMFIEQAPISMAMFDRGMNYLAYSQRWLADYGRGYPDLSGRNHYQVHPDLPEQWKAVHRRALAGEMVKNDEDHWRQADGRDHWLRWAVMPWRDERGEVGGIIMSAEDITERKRAEEGLREANLHKDEFLAMLAHELRNPLVPIQNAAHVLGLGLDEPRLAWAQGMIESQVTYLTRLVDDLLDISRIARGKIALKKERVDLSELMRRAREGVALEMTAKAHRFDVRLPEEHVDLDGDPVRLVQVLQNLLSNAAKYTPDGGHIVLTARASGDEAEIEVSDNGFGIPAELLPHVFDLFRQGERNLDRSQGGLGIGLTLVSRLVELHGGRVVAQSAGPGQGSSFRVHLPLAQAVQEATSPVEMVPRPPAGLRLLVVDDDPAVSESMVVCLELQGHEVRSAAAGEAALDLLKTFRPDVVLLDIGLPGEDGYSVARRIRELPEGRDVPLLAVSGYGHEEARARSLEAGFDLHLVKPVDPEKLRVLLARVSKEDRRATDCSPSGTPPQ
jgi:PAS domain S-box-containing protein